MQILCNGLGFATSQELHDEEWTSHAMVQLDRDFDAGAELATEQAVPSTVAGLKPGVDILLRALLLDRNLGAYRGVPFVRVRPTGSSKSLQGENLPCLSKKVLENE